MPACTFARTYRFLTHILNTPDTHHRLATPSVDSSLIPAARTIYDVGWFLTIHRRLASQWKQGSSSPYVTFVAVQADTHTHIYSFVWVCDHEHVEK